MTTFFKIICSFFLFSCCFLPQHQNYAISNPNIVLITIDGVRWQEIFNGTDQLTAEQLLPNFYRYFVSNGTVLGKNSEIRLANPAHISLPGYLEILSGASSQTCFTNDCPQNISKTLPNEFEGKIGIFGSWQYIQRVIDKEQFETNVGRNYRSQKWQTLHLPDNRDFPISFGDEEDRWDLFTQQAAMDYLLKYNPEFLWIAFGDTDEYAHRGDYEHYLLSLRQIDKFIGRLIQTSYGQNATLIITTDHGRGQDWRNHGKDKASERVWIAFYGVNVPSFGFPALNKIMHSSDIYETVMFLAGKKSIENSLFNPNLYKAGK